MFALMYSNGNLVFQFKLILQYVHILRLREWHLIVGAGCSFKEQIVLLLNAVKMLQKYLLVAFFIFYRIINNRKMSYDAVEHHVSY